MTTMDRFVAKVMSKNERLMVVGTLGLVDYCSVNR